MAERGVESHSSKRQTRTEGEPQYVPVGIVEGQGVVAGAVPRGGTEGKSRPVPPMREVLRVGMSVLTMKSKVRLALLATVRFDGGDDAWSCLHPAQCRRGLSDRLRLLESITRTSLTALWAGPGIESELLGVVVVSLLPCAAIARGGSRP